MLSQKVDFVKTEIPAFPSFPSKVIKLRMAEQIQQPSNILKRELRLRGSSDSEKV